MEELFKELSEFVRKNRKVFKLTEQWLKEFDGNLDDAWNVAKNALIVDWRKIVLVVKRTLDEGVEFLLNTILSGSYTTREHPNIYLIRNALNEGEKVVADEKLKKNKTPDDSMQGQGNNRRVSSGEWSNPMTKSAMMSRVGIDGYKKFNTFAKQHGLQQAGNRQLWQICLDGMDKNTRQKLEKA